MNLCFKAPELLSTYISVSSEQQLLKAESYPLPLF